MAARPGGFVTTSSDERDLLSRFRAGDEEALRRLLDRDGAALRAHIERCLPAYLRRRVSTSDIVQEAGIVAFRRCGDFEDRGDGSFRKWVKGIAEKKVRAAIERHLETAKRAAGREVSRTHRKGTAQFASREPSPSQAAIGAELAEFALEAMRALPKDHREVLRLAREEQLPLREVADRMDRSYEATRKLYARAIRRFADLLDSMRETGA